MGVDDSRHLTFFPFSQGHNFMLLCQVPIGVCRHKALLFKILADIVNLNCAVITGYSTAGRHQ